MGKQGHRNIQKEIIGSWIHFLLYCDSGTSNSNGLQINIMVQIKLMRDESVIAYPGP